MNYTDRQFKDFWNGYRKAIWFFHLYDERLEDAGIDPMLVSRNFTKDTREKLQDRAREFLRDAASLIKKEPDKDFSQAGHDFYLTCDNHGAGFWDGDWPEHGDELDNLCDGFSSLSFPIRDGDRIRV